MPIKTSAPIPQLVFKSYDELTELYQTVEHIPEEIKEDIPIYGSINNRAKSINRDHRRLKTIQDDYIKQNYFEQ